MCGNDYPEFFEIEDRPSTFFERWIWPVLGFFLVVACSVASGIVEFFDAFRHGLGLLRDDVCDAWRAER